MSNTTICAKATAMGQAGIGVVRISGDKSLSIAKKILKFNPKPRYAYYVPFFDNKGNEIDKGIAIFYKSPNSFTGEDILELQGHGGIVVIDMVLNACINFGAKVADAGEFSKRAFLNGKIDLAQAEAIADLIAANSKQAAMSALRSLSGDFSKKVANLVKKIINIRKFIEASIDFSDEEITFLELKQIKTKLKKIKTKLKEIIANSEQGAILRDGIYIIITGKPNVGKSSILNVLTKQESAIVTAIAGTTRDILKERILIDGIPINIIDSAGLRKSYDEVEKQGIKKTKVEIKKADVVLLVYDAREKPDLNLVPNDKHILLVKNKIDLLDEDIKFKTKINNKVLAEVSISAKKNKNIEKLKTEIKKIAGANIVGEDTIMARKRHIIHLKKAYSFISNAYLQLKNEAIELAAEDLRQTQKQLNLITGEFSSDDLLGEIFSSFCIGK